MQCHQCFLFDCDVIYVVLFVKALSRLEVMLLSLNLALVQNHPDSKILTRLLTFLSCKKVYRQIYFIKNIFLIFFLQCLLPLIMMPLNLQPIWLIWNFVKTCSFFGIYFLEAFFKFFKAFFKFFSCYVWKRRKMLVEIYLDLVKSLQDTFLALVQETRRF